ncbi:MAG TPA: GNAT family N-acetyltransferase [Sphingomonas sp.]|nr:GNAT family N-acetyltransferase [Sphingomonas sp.]
MFARTKRLTLRPGWPEDAPALAAAIAHESVVTRLARVPWPYTEADAAAFLAQPHAPHETVLMICAHEGGAPRLVGTIGIHAQGAVHEFGYWLTPDAWGRGYATEAGRAVIDIARRALPVVRLEAGYFADNPASGNVLRKLGFRDTGRRERRPSRARGALVDAVVMELDVDDRWAAIPIAA